jgi:uncharacterized protein (TIGR02598 family)
MNRHARPSAFTLTEIVLALAIIATVFVAVLGLLPAGLDASRQAANSTVVSTVLENLHQRLQNQPLKKGPVPFSPAYFDDRGVFIPADDATQVAKRLYRADVTIGDWAIPPANTSDLRPVTIALSWPVDSATGTALGKDNPKTVVTYAATTLTGPDWPLIHPSGRPDLRYEPRIEF